jgi:hypothetical protein
MQISSAGQGQLVPRIDKILNDGSLFKSKMNKETSIKMNTVSCKIRRSSHIQFVKSSDDGVKHRELLGSWTLPIVRYSRR